MIMLREMELAKMNRSRSIRSHGLLTVGVTSMARTVQAKTPCDIYLLIRATAAEGRARGQRLASNGFRISLPA
jgi:hypothetical protein